MVRVIPTGCTADAGSLIEQPVTFSDVPVCFPFAQRIQTTIFSAHETILLRPFAGLSIRSPVHRAPHPRRAEAQCPLPRGG